MNKAIKRERERARDPHEDGKHFTTAKSVTVRDADLPVRRFEAF